MNSRIDFRYLFRILTGKQYRLDSQIVYAAKEHQVDRVKKLLTQGADVNAENGWLLKIAIRDENFPLLDLLLAQKELGIRYL